MGQRKKSCLKQYQLLLHRLHWQIPLFLREKHCLCLGDIDCIIKSDDLNITSTARVTEENVGDLRNFANGTKYVFTDTTKVAAFKAGTVESL